MAVIEIAEVSSSSGRAGDLEAAIPQILEVLAGQPGAGTCAALRGVEDPGAFLLEIEWDSLEAHAAFRKSPDFSRYQALVRGLMEGDARLAHYRLVARVGG